MTEFFTVKKIDNSRMVRLVAPNRMLECAKLAGMASLIALFAFLYAWQHFEAIQLRYRLETLRAEQTQASELNQELQLEVAGLRAPGRIDLIARRQLGLTVPVPGQVGPITPTDLPAGAVFAEAHPANPQAAQ